MYDSRDILNVIFNQSDSFFFVHHIIVRALIALLCWQFEEIVCQYYMEVTK